MKCSNSFCGRDLAADALFCPYCGTKVSAVCLNCGAALIPDAAFCSKCGTMVGAFDEISNNSAAQPNPAVNPFFTPVTVQAPQRKEIKAFTPSAEPFLKNWIAEHSEWAKAYNVGWISKFYGDYAVAVNDRLSNGGRLGYYLIKGEQEPKLCTGISMDYSVNTSKFDIYDSETCRFNNGNKYIAYDFSFPNSKEVLNDDNFLKAFGGKNFCLDKETDNLHFCGVIAFDGTRLWARYAVSKKAFFEFGQYIAFGDYVAKYNKKGEIPEKNFHPYDIVNPEMGKTIIANVSLPFDDINNSVLNDYGTSFFLFIPYHDHIDRYGSIFPDDRPGLCAWPNVERNTQQFVKVFLPSCGEIISCNEILSFGEDFHSGQVLLLKHDKSAQTIAVINRFGKKAAECPFNADRENFFIYQVKFGRKEYLGINFNFTSNDCDLFSEVFEVHGGLQTANPYVSYKGLFKYDILEHQKGDVEYNGVAYNVYTDFTDKCTYVFDENLDIKFKIAAADNPSIFTGDDNILYCSYTKADNITKWLYIHNLNSNKVVAKYPAPKWNCKIGKAVTVNGVLLFREEGYYPKKNYYNTKIFLKGLSEYQVHSDATNAGNDFLEECGSIELLKKLKRLPKFKGVFLKDYNILIVDLNTGDVEEEFDYRDGKEKLIDKYG